MIYNRKKFFDAVRKSFGSLKQTQVDGFGYLLSAWESRYPQGDVRYLAYALATTWHETAYTMQPIEEYGRGKGRKYGPTGYWGRGYVQLTWDYNYRKAQERLKELFGINVDLVKHPDRAMEPEIAVLILYVGMIEGWFTGKKLSDYFTATTSDPTNARRIINGTDKAAKIAGHHTAFLRALEGAQEASASLPAPIPASTDPEPSVVILEGPKEYPTREPSLLVTALILLRDWLLGKR